VIEHQKCQCGRTLPAPGVAGMKIVVFCPCGKVNVISEKKVQKGKV
jgi:hypothetical protein